MLFLLRLVFSIQRQEIGFGKRLRNDCRDAFPIEAVLVATYLLSVEALPHCRCGVANRVLWFEGG